MRGTESVLSVSCGQIDFFIERYLLSKSWARIPEPRRQSSLRVFFVRSPWTQNIPLPRSLNLQLLVDVFNVYNKQTGYDYETRIGTLGACTGSGSQCVETGITSIRTSRPSLEEVYVHLIGDRGLKI